MTLNDEFGEVNIVLLWFIAYVYNLLDKIVLHQL